MLKNEKKHLVAEFKEELKVHNVVLLLEHDKLTFSAYDAARRASNGQTVIKKVKNNLLKIAFEGSKYDALNEHLKNERLVIMSNDLFAACKSARFLLDNNKNQLKILKGSTDKDVYEPNTLVELSAINSVEELQSKLLRVIKVVGENVVRVIKARCDASNGSGE